MEVCPQGTYLNTTSRQCVPCHEACQGGCAGPLPYVNRTFGCLECDRVQLDREGRQVRVGEGVREGLHLSCLLLGEKGIARIY